MCSPSGIVFVLIASLILNCLHFDTVGAIDIISDNNNNNNNNRNSKNINIINSSSDSGSNESILKRPRIDITRKQSLHLNGVEIDETSLLQHLEEHEKELIFGKYKGAPRSVKLVHLKQTTTKTANTNADADAANELKQQNARRVKRAAISKRKTSVATDEVTRPIGAPHVQEISVNIKDDDQMVNLKLHQTPKLIDDAFIFIRRYANSSQFIEDAHQLAEKYERCFYSSEKAALDLCDHESVRGIFHHNATDYIIHPLPSRFGNSNHVIYESDHQASTRAIHENLQFEPKHDEFDDDIGADGAISLRNNNLFNNETLSNAQQRHNYNNYNLKRQQQEQRTNYDWRYKPRYHHDGRHYQSHHHIQKQRQSHRGHHQQRHHYHNRTRRHIASGSQWKIPQVLHIETAIFVDNDLFKHMAKNFPKNTENHLIRFVLAMINGVQLLYHHPSLGHRINFVLKRLEILYTDPKDLRRSSDIDIYLSNFCMWQKSLNPPSDADAVHYDHAVILTGLDLYVVGKNGKVISQVVGLAPVAGMCTPTSSCTINEGKHFESVFVVAHEIGHNLGMRHDTKENSCDPSLYIMSPTLGSGKITWSKCSRTYLNTFLENPQANCLFDRGQFVNNLDHSAEGMLPGERFDANQQCMLKYGKDSVRAPNQLISDICRDLHCQRDRYTWTSHPALEGTECGDQMWCRSGVCVTRPVTEMALSSTKQLSNPVKPGYDKASFVESSKMGHLLHEYNFNKSPTWGEWGEASDCDSGCLYGPSKRLREGSTGLRTYSRSCLDYRRRCMGRDRKFESCVAKQCYHISITTIEDFATQVCEKSQKFDADLTGEGQQIVGDVEESCKVFCKTKSNGTKARSWTFPDGTTCRSKLYSYDDTAYCIAGRCEKFSCDNSTQNYYKIDPIFCSNRSPQLTERDRDRDREKKRPIKEIEGRRVDGYKNRPFTFNRYADSNSNYYNYNVNRRDSGIYGPTTVRSKYENEVAVRSYHGQPEEQQFKRKSEAYQPWNKYNYRLNDHQPEATPGPPQPPSPPISASLVAVSVPESDWIVKSGCHSSCMANSKGVQVVTSRRTGANNIQLCTHAVKPCERLQTATEFAENTCSRYKLKVRGLSGFGTQIAASIEEPDRSCRVGCQDEFLKYRYYLVNGKYGHFPLGTKCSHTEERYCINGKCLEFGPDNIPLQQSHISLALFRSKRSIMSRTTNSTESLRRLKRSYLYYDPVNITETLTQEFINSIVHSIINFERQHLGNDDIADEHIEFSNPVHQSTDD